ncbi:MULTISPECIES: glycerate kinase type-2 family protein [unclassified Phaeobacter]|uniref:glycerate kinase type-2 family protein n=1 Tax=unclassified Phaeobacter TaxID=2621772 RepID=UPI003A84FA9B
MADLRSTFGDLFAAAIARADPAMALAESLRQHPPPLPRPGGRLILIALGKAAVPMMRQAMRMLPPSDRAVAVTNPENLAEIPGASVLAGDHPVPNDMSLAAGAVLRQAVGDLTANDSVVALISGGGSALAVAPAAGLTLAHKTAVTDYLLGAGLDIMQMNLIRQQLSELKGGGLLRSAYPAPVCSYILSDVIGDDLRAIASGPTVAPLGSRTMARDCLVAHDLWASLPGAVQTHLSAQDDPAQTLFDKGSVTAYLIGSNRHSLIAMKELAARKGWSADIVDDALTGDVEAAAARIISAAQARVSNHPVALIFGGETTVNLTGTGRGGRNQELALHVARLGRQTLSGSWAFLSAGTDGRDGPTDAAGGIVDGGTWQRILDKGGDPMALLRNNDSNRALRFADDLFVTGGTGTNVADIQIMLLPAR